MEMIAPLGPVYQAGTLSGNPLAMRAGLSTLPKLEATGFYDALNRKTDRLAEGLRSALKDAGAPGVVNLAGSSLTLFFAHAAVRNYADAKKSDTARFGAFFRAMLDGGVYLPPSQYEAAFLGATHTEQDVQQTVAAAKQAFAKP